MRTGYIPLATERSPIRNLDNAGARAIQRWSLGMSSTTRAPNKSNSAPSTPLSAEGGSPERSVSTPGSADRYTQRTPCTRCWLLRYELRRLSAARSVILNIKMYLLECSPLGDTFGAMPNRADMIPGDGPPRIWCFTRLFLNSRATTALMSGSSREVSANRFDFLKS